MCEVADPPESRLFRRAGGTCIALLAPLAVQSAPEAPSLGWAKPQAKTPPPEPLLPPPESARSGGI